MSPKFSVLVPRLISQVTLAVRADARDVTYINMGRPHITHGIH